MMRIQWTAVSGLGQGVAPVPLATFTRGSKTETLDWWMNALRTGTATSDPVLPPPYPFRFRHATLWARSSVNPDGFRVIVPDRFDDPEYVDKIFREGGLVPHPVLGGVWVEPYLYDLKRKGLFTIFEEALQPKTLYCQTERGHREGGGIFTTPRTVGVKFGDVSDAQAIGIARRNGAAHVCRGVGTRSGVNWDGKPYSYTIQPDGTITSANAPPPSRTDVYCPSDNFRIPVGDTTTPRLRGVCAATAETLDVATLEVPSPPSAEGAGGRPRLPGERIYTRECALAWAKSRPCQSMMCRNVYSGAQEKFYDCPGGGKGGGDDKRGPVVALAIGGAIAIGVALLAAGRRAS